MYRIQEPRIRNRYYQCNTSDASIVPYFIFVLLVKFATGCVFILSVKYNSVYLYQCSILMFWVSFALFVAGIYIASGSVESEFTNDITIHKNGHA